MNSYTLPHNDDAERAVLGAILLKNAVLQQVKDELKPEDFYNVPHRITYEAMLLLGQSGSIDLVSLKTHLLQTDNLATVGGALYIANLLNAIPTAANVLQHARLIKRKAVQRAMISLSERIAREATEDTEGLDEALLKVEGEASFLQSSLRNRQSEHVEPLAVTYGAKVEMLYRNPGMVRGISTGYRHLDKATGGYQPGQYIIIAGRPGMGKTSLALCQAYRMAREGNPVAFFSIEMSKDQIVGRLVSIDSGIDYWRYNSGTMHPDEYELFNDSIQRIMRLPIYIQDAGDLTPAGIRSEARTLRNKEGTKCAFVDYLQLMQPNTRSHSETRQTTEMSNSLKSAAKELGMPFVVLSQLNRECENNGSNGLKGRPALHNLRQSGAIEQDADKVFFVYRPERYGYDSIIIDSRSQSARAPKPTDAETPVLCAGLAEIIIAKQRNNMAGISRWMRYLGGSMSFQPVDFKEEESWEKTQA